jgi:hypothetical protein
MWLEPVKFKDVASHINALEVTRDNHKNLDINRTPNSTQMELECI